MSARKKDRILVSVVVPAYNAAGFITTAIDSVLAQTVTDVEILIINDGSPDTEQLEWALLPYTSQIRYLKQEHRGPSAARNLGIKSAQGRYVAFLDSDDAWLPEHLATQLAVLRSDPSLGLVYSDSVLQKNGSPIGRTFDRESQVLPVTFDALLEELCTVNLSTAVAARQDLIDAGLFDETLVRCEDFDLWLRMAFRGTRMTHHSAANVCRTVSPSGLSANEYLMRCSRFTVLTKVGSMMALSQSQQELLGRRLRFAEAMVNLDRLKLLMYAGQFAEALIAAQQAASVLHSRKLRLAVAGLRVAPRILRAYYRLHEQMLAARNQRRHAAYARTIDAAPVAVPTAGVTVPQTKYAAAGLGA